MSLHLVWEERVIPLVPGENLLGRDEDVAVRIDAPGVSRHCARIAVVGDEATLEDLGSKNGTYLRGRRVEGPTPSATETRSDWAPSSGLPVLAQGGLHAHGDQGPAQPRLRDRQADAGRVEAAVSRAAVPGSLLGRCGTLAKPAGGRGERYEHPPR